MIGHQDRGQNEISDAQLHSVNHRTGLRIMRSLILQGDGYATERPDDAQLTAMEPFVQLGELPRPGTW